MKEVSEEWQLKLFDLLEGNLNEHECTLLMKEISNNPDLQREYNLLKATYLQPDETEVYAYKNLLLKQGSKGLWIRFNRKQYAAAASLLLICGLGALMFLQTNQQTEKARLTKVTAPQKSDLSRKTTKDTNRFLPIPNNLRAIAQHDIIATEVVTPKLKAAVSSDTGVINAPQSFATAKSEILPRDLSLINPGNEEINFSTYRIWVYYPTDGPVSGTKKRTLSYKLLNTTRTMLATLNFPSISVKAKSVKGKLIPAINIRVQLPQNENNILANYTE